MTSPGFRQFLRELRSPVPYFPITYEARGALNLVLGLVELAVGECFKHMASPRLNAAAPSHIHRGLKGMRLGAIQFLPGFLITMGTYYAAALYYTHTLPMATPVSYDLSQA